MKKNKLGIPIIEYFDSYKSNCIVKNIVTPEHSGDSIYLSYITGRYITKGYQGIKLKRYDTGLFKSVYIKIKKFIKSKIK